MKKLLILVIFVFLAARAVAQCPGDKKIVNIQKAYVFLEEEMLVNETDLNCSYFIKEDVPRDIRIVAANLDTGDGTTSPTLTTW